MNSALARRHALGLPQGSVRATHMLVIVGLMCAMLAVPRLAELPIPSYLIYLLFLMLGHYFAGRGGTTAARDPGQPTPLHLPGGSIRFLVMASLVAAIGWRMFQDPESLRRQFELSLDALKAQPLLPLMILGGFFAGVILRTIVGRSNPPQWLQDFEAWVSLLALLGLGVAVVVHLIVAPSLEVPVLTWPTWEAILGSVIAFYFGERS